MIVALCTLAGALWLMQLEASHIQPSWPILIDGYGDVMPQGAIGRCGTLRLRHKGWIGSRGVPRAGSVAFSPNGELLATGGQSVCFWEVSTGKLRRYFQTNDFVRAIACSSDGTAAIAAEGELMVVQVSTGTSLRLPIPPGVNLASVCFSPTARLLAAAGDQGLATVWRTSDWRVVYQNAKSDEAFITITFSQDGKLLGALGKDLHLWKVSEWKRVSPGPRLPKAPLAIAFTGRRTDLALLQQGGVVAIWDPITWTRQRNVSVATGVSSMAFSGTGDALIVRDKSGRTYVIDPSTGRLKYTLGADYAILTTAAAPSPDGTKLAATTAGALVILADLGTGTLRRPQAVHDAPVTTLAFARGGRSLISGDDAGKVRLWKLPECELARAFDDCESQACVAMSTETSKCASGGKTIQLRGLWTGELLRSYPGNFSSSIAFSPDGNWLGSGGPDGSILVYDLTKGGKVVRMKHPGPFYRYVLPHARGVTSIAFTGDGGRVVAAGCNDVSYMFDCSTGELLRAFRGHEGRVSSVAISSSSQLMTSVDEVGSVRLWNMQDGSQLKECTDGRAEERYFCVAFSPDDRMIAAGNDQGTIRVWEVLTGYPRLEFSGHNGEVNALAFSHDCRLLASGSEDTTILLWSLSTIVELQDKPFGAKGLEEAWRDLGSVDAKRAYWQIRRLSIAPAKSVRFLAGKLHPVREVDAEHIKSLISALGSNDFRRRTSAFEELRSAAEQAREAMRDVLAARPEPEVRERIERLLKELEPASENRLREQRAIEVLERIGTTEAQDALRGLAQGARRALLTQVAKASLGRLERTKLK